MPPLGKGGAPPTKLIALTFDDGPFSHTDELLSILENYNAHATFFVTGENTTRYPKQAYKIQEAGHDIGNHSWSHTALNNAALDKIRQELSKSSAAISAITGKDPTLFRAPFLSYSENLTQVAKEMGMSIIGTQIFSMDWENIGHEQVASNVIHSAKDGGIILDLS